MAKKMCKPMVKRMFISLTLGALFGLLCAYFASTNTLDPNFWGSAVMWSIFFNRFVIGFVVALAGFIVVHPLLNIRMYPVCRGACAGFLVSLSLAFGAYSTGGEQANIIFWGSIVSGMIYGLIIDLVATKVAGEGETLLPGTQK
ncbi:MAG: hypothetical protein PHH06_01865 [Candidatus Gracilibacteria bacterium]|nr:hypothetical protein [Candidatus Gracilibacteria bacterium]